MELTRKLPDTRIRKSIIIKDINLEIKKGEIIAIMGYSGSGKSALMNSISGLTNSGKGEAPGSYNSVTGPEYNAKIILQNDRLIPWLSVYQNIYDTIDKVMPPRTSAEKHVETCEVLNRVNLDSYKDQLPGQLSCGLKQLVAVARSFALNPKVLLLDEPFRSLDATTKGSMHMELLRLWHLDNRQKTIVIATNDIEEAIFLSDRVIVINSGPAATIKTVIDIALPRPRFKKDMLKNPLYTEIKDKLLSLLFDRFSSNN